jgi:hypothetical protein
MWTHGMNRFVAIVFHLEPDIWGTMVGMLLMTVALVLIPFVDRASSEPVSWAEALSLRRRGWAYLLMALFWVILIIGSITNIVSPKG